MLILPIILPFESTDPLQQTVTLLQGHHLKMASYEGRNMS
jgi:hypothetical protein